MAIFGKLAYDEGVDVGSLLLVRFALAAPCSRRRRVARRAARPAAPRGARRPGDGRDRLRDAGGPVLPRARAHGRLAALAAALHVSRAGDRRGDRARPRGAVGAQGRGARAGERGTALVLAGAGTGALDPLATVMALGAAAAYTAYILTGDRVVAGVPPLALAALVTAGATVTFGAAVLDHRRAGPRLRRRGLGLAGRDRAGVAPSARSSRSSRASRAWARRPPRSSRRSSP